MKLTSRRDFLRRGSQVGAGAILGAVAGCMGNGGSGQPDPIKNISFATTEMIIEVTESAVGKTINLLPPDSDKPIQDWSVTGGKTSIRFSLVKRTIQGVMPISSGTYTIQVVKDTKVVNKRTIDLYSDIRLINVSNSTESAMFDANIKLSNRGTLPAHIEYLGVPSGVPDPSDKSEFLFSRIDSYSTNLQRGIGVNKTAKFSPNAVSLFRLGSEKEMRNYTVGNSSFDSRRCDGNQRQATLVIKTSQGSVIKQPFTYSLSGDVTRSAVDYQCANFSVTFPENQSRATTSSQTSN